MVYPHYETIKQGYERTLEVIDAEGGVVSQIVGKMVDCKYTITIADREYSLRPNGARCLLDLEGVDIAELVEAWKDADIADGTLALLEIWDESLLAGSYWLLPFAMVWAQHAALKYDLV